MAARPAQAGPAARPAAAAGAGAAAPPEYEGEEECEEEEEEESEEEEEDEDEKSYVKMKVQYEGELYPDNVHWKMKWAKLLKHFRKEYQIDRGVPMRIQYQDGQERLTIKDERAWRRVTSWYWDEQDDEYLRVFLSAQQPGSSAMSTGGPSSTQRSAASPTSATAPPTFVAAGSGFQSGGGIAAFDSTMTSSSAGQMQSPISLGGGQQPPRWQRGRLLGKGAFGSVYEGLDGAGRLIAVKVIELGEAGADSEALEALRCELNLMNDFDHPNVVRLYGSYTDSQALYIFMQYAPGGSLASLVRRFGRLRPGVLRSYTKQLLEGLKYLHAREVVHRDIKGDNLLLGESGEVKVADFGCSKKIDNLCAKSHGCKTMVGTPYWMAPEVIALTDETGYGPKADIWSVGCTVIEMMGGKAWPEFDSPWSAVYHIANSTGPPPGIPADCHPLVKAFLLRCFARNVDDRADAATLLEMDLFKVSEAELGDK